MKLRHVGIPVGDLQEAIQFYQQFDFYPLSFESVEIAGGVVEIAKLAHKEGSVIELIDGATAIPHISITTGRLLFEVLKEHRDTKKFKKDGVCYIEDPWGNIIEIVEERGF